MRSQLEEIKTNHEFRKGEGWELTTLTEDIDWLIEQAEKVESLTNGIKEVRRYIDEHSGDVDKPRRLTMDEIYGVFMKLTRLL